MMETNGGHSKRGSSKHRGQVVPMVGGAAVEQNTQQMFYGDYQCDGDEPEEDDMSKQEFSGSQFSDDVISCEDAESDPEQPDADS